MSRFISGLIGDQNTLSGIYPITVGSDNSISFSPSADDSTSATTGSLVTPGGLGIGKNLFIGQEVSLTRDNCGIPRAYRAGAECHAEPPGPAPHV